MNPQKAHKPGRGSAITINAHRQQPKVEQQRESWWLNMPAEGFSDTCAKRPFRYVTGPLLKSWTVD